jgi:hypothetical protein
MQYIALGEADNYDSEADAVFERLGVRWPNGTIDWFPRWGVLHTPFGNWTVDQIIADDGEKKFQDAFDAHLRKLRLVPGPQHDVLFTVRLEKTHFTYAVDIDDRRVLRDEQGGED